jgi:hypothetical protein
MFWMEVYNNLLFSQPSIMVIKPINISLIYTFYNMPSQVEGEELTWSLNQKAVKEAKRSDVVKISTSWS